MTVVCSQCGGTGRNGEEFCSCSKGEMEKRLERSRERAERAKLKEREAMESETKEKPAEETKRTRKRREITIDPPCDVGDWAEIISGRFDGVVGIITAHRERGQKSELHAIRHVAGHSVTGSAWIEWHELRPLPMQREEDDVLILVDMALDMKDENWFMELVKTLP